MNFEYFIPSNFQFFADWVLKSALIDETSVVIASPRGDVRWRIAQILQDFNPPLPALSLQLFPGDVEEIQDLERMIESRRPEGTVGQPLLIFITNAHQFIDQHKCRILSQIIDLQEKSNTYKFILVFQRNIAHPTIVSQLGDERRLFRRIFYYSLYDEAETIRFIEHMCEKWSITISSTVQKKIARACGGWMWLINHILRTLRDSPHTPLEEIYQSDEMQFKVGDIYRSLIPSDQSYLKETTTHSDKSDASAQASEVYLYKIGILKNNQISSDLFDEYIRRQQTSLKLTARDNHIFLNEVNIDATFSRKERKILLLLLANLHTVVSRELVGETGWSQMDEGYTDWALDNLIARLRKKLTSLGLPKDVIQTERNAGYKITINQP
jgi:hypothetical protein